MKGKPLGTEIRRNRSRRAVVLSAASVTATAIALAGADVASAGTLTVSATASRGHGSLKQAIERANSSEDRDTIVFSRRLHGAIRLPSALTITQPVLVHGRGYADPTSAFFGRVKLTGGTHGKPLEVELSERGQGASLRDLYLNRVPIHARAMARGTRIAVKDSFITGDTTARGAGVEVGRYRESDGGIVRVDYSTIREFESGVSVISASAKVQRSTIADNVGDGGVDVSVYADAKVTQSTISGNVVEAGLSGGGIRAYYYSTARVTNSTITGNTVESEGGYGGGVAGSVVVSQSTITGNAAESGGGIGFYAFGVNEGPPTVSNSIVAGNTSTGGGGGDCGFEVPLGSTRPGFASHGGNLIESPGSCAVAPTDLTGVDPGLEPLAENGGPTATQALQLGSPAIDLALPGQATKVDQRGAARGKHPDSGAFELLVRF